MAGGKDDAAGTLTADVAVVQRAAFDITITSNGELEARRKLEVRSKLEQETTIQSIVDEGVRVKAGDLLIQLNADSIQTRIDEENPRLLTAKAELDAAENGYKIQMNDNASALRKAELNVELAELALRQWQEGDVAKSRQELDLKVDRAELELERLAQKLVRSEELLAEGYLSKDECDRDEVAYIEAISDFTTSRLAREVFDKYEYVKDEKQKNSDVAEARAELERVRLNNDIELKTKETRRDIERDQVLMNENRLKKLREQHGWATITAPQDGLVVYSTSLENSRWGNQQGPLQIGQQVYPNQLLMILPDTSEMIASVRVHESVAGRVRPGQVVTVKVDAAGGKVFQGEVESIGVMAESGGWRDPNLREYIVRVGLDSLGENLKPAMRCEARLNLDEVAETLTVPMQAVFNDGAVQFVYQPRGSKFVRCPVRIGKRSDVLAEIKAGVEEGERVLVREPSAGEVISQPWDQGELKLAGYKVGENGQVIAEGRPERPSGRGNGRSGGKPDATAAATPGTSGVPAVPTAHAGAAAEKTGDGESATTESTTTPTTESDKQK